MVQEVISSFSQKSQLKKHQSNSYMHRISICPVEGKGFGVFTKERVLSGQLICSNVAKDLSTDINCSDMSLFQYFFSVSKEYPNKSYVIVCGEMVFLNHSDTPNAEVVWQQGQTGLLFANLISIVDINLNEEVTIKYSDIERYKTEKLI